MSSGCCRDGSEVNDFSTIFSKPSSECYKVKDFYCSILKHLLAALAQMVACLPLVQQVRVSIPGGVVNYNLKILNLGARRDGDVHFLIARLYITDCT